MKRYGGAKGQFDSVRARDDLIWRRSKKERSLILLRRYSMSIMLNREEAEGIRRSDTSALVAGIVI